MAVSMSRTFTPSGIWFEELVTTFSISEVAISDLYLISLFSFKDATCLFKHNMVDNLSANLGDFSFCFLLLLL